MIDPRQSHAAVLLSDGRVLVAGGLRYGIDNPTALAELYDPQTDTWTATTRMHGRREGIQAFLHPDGKVLVVGGPYRGHVDGELYDPATESWTQIPAVARIRGGETLTALADGRVLMTGAGDAFDAAEVFDPGAATWTAVGPMLAPHRAPATLLLDGTVLVAGGNQCLEGVDEVCVATDSAELYVPAGVSPPTFSFPSPAPPVFPSPTP
jgi:hypothetical protein